MAGWLAGQTVFSKYASVVGGLLAWTNCCSLPTSQAALRWWLMDFCGWNGYSCWALLYCQGLGWNTSKRMILDWGIICILLLLVNQSIDVLSSFRTSESIWEVDKASKIMGSLSSADWLRTKLATPLLSIYHGLAMARKTIHMCCGCRLDGGDDHYRLHFTILLAAPEWVIIWLSISRVLLCGI